MYQNNISIKRRIKIIYGYIGAKNLDDIKNAKFIKITKAGFRKHGT